MKFVRLEENRDHMIEIISILCLMGITILLHSLFFGRFSIIYLSEDEYGPIAIAAYFAGQDWSQTLKYVAYYSYGYSILLFPLFVITKGAVQFYQAAMILNIFLNALIVPMAYYIGKKLFPNTKKLNLCVAAFASANLTANIARTESAWCETLIMVLIWLMIVLVIRINEKPTFVRVLQGSVVAVYLYAVHQRCVGILIAYLLMLLILWGIKKVSLKCVAANWAIVIAMFLVHGKIKDYIQNVIYRAGLEISVNDYSGRISGIFSGDLKNRLISLFCTFSNQMTYVILATSGLALFAFVQVCLDLAKERKNGLKILLQDNVVKLYCILGTMGIGSVSVLGASPQDIYSYTRSDQTIYGRYIEVVLGFWVLYAILSILENRISKLCVLVCIIAGSIMCYAAVKVYTPNEGLPFNYSCSVMMCLVRNRPKLAMLYAGMTFIVLVYILIFKNLYLKNIALWGMSAGWIVFGVYYLHYFVLSFQNDFSYFYQRVPELAQYDEICYVGNAVESSQDTVYQYALKDIKTISVLEDENLRLQNGAIGMSEDLSRIIQDGYLVKDFYHGMFFFESDADNSEVNIPLNAFYSSFLNSGEEICNNGEQGALMFGPYCQMKLGRYSVQIEYTVDDCDGAICGATDIVCDEYEEKLAVASLPSDQNSIDIEFELEKDVNNFQIRVWVSEPCHVDVKKVAIKMID